MKTVDISEKIDVEKLVRENITILDECTVRLKKAKRLTMRESQEIRLLVSERRENIRLLLSSGTNTGETTPLSSALQLLILSGLGGEKFRMPLSYVFRDVSTEDVKLVIEEMNEIVKVREAKI